MRAFDLAAAAVLLATGCKRDEAAPTPPPPPPPQATVGETATPSAPAPVMATPSASVSASATASAGAGVVDAGVDTSKWETKELDALGATKFAFDGTIMFPKGTKTRTSGAKVSSGGSAGTFAFLDLPDGTQVMLDERSAASPKDGSMVKQLITQTSGGTLTVDRTDANGFFYAFQTSEGVIVQGASWAVSPGLGCATAKAITSTKVDEVAAICASLRPKAKK